MVVPFCGSYLGSHKVTPKKELLWSLWVLEYDLHNGSHLPAVWDAGQGAFERLHFFKGSVGIPKGSKYLYGSYLVAIGAPKVHTILVLGPFGIDDIHITSLQILYSSSALIDACLHASGFRS